MSDLRSRVSEFVCFAICRNQVREEKHTSSERAKAGHD